VLARPEANAVEAGRGPLEPGAAERAEQLLGAVHGQVPAEHEPGAEQSHVTHDFLPFVAVIFVLPAQD
jgi:hypothetical protein